MNLSCNELLTALRQDFGVFWTCKRIGETLELSTPYLLPNHDLLQLYLTIRDDRIIVTDGASVSNYLGEELDADALETESGITLFLNSHAVLKHQAPDGRVFYYKETNRLELISSLIFDLGNFATAVTSTIASQFSDTVETAAIHRFTTKAKTFLLDSVKLIPNRHIEFNKGLDDLTEVKFNAIITDTLEATFRPRRWLISYVTGSNSTDFAHNCNKAIVNYTLFKNSSTDNRAILIPLLNNESPGYQPSKFEARLTHLKAITGRAPILWTSRDHLIQTISDSGELILDS